ncbi:hypothetical protein [Salinirussus salinus]|nr:hypothetical protein [Salinirussus salinus]
MLKKLEKPPEGAISGSNDREVQNPNMQLDPVTRRKLREVGLYV